MNYKEGIPYKVLLLVSVAMISIVFYTPIMFILDNDKDEISNTLALEKSSASIIGELMRNAVVNDDRDEISKIIGSAISHQNLYSINVTNESGDLIGYVKNEGNENNSDLIDIPSVRIRELNFYSETNNETGSGKLEGTMILAFADNMARQSDKWTLVKAILLSVVLGMVCLLVIYMVMGERDKQYTEMIESAKRLAGGERDVRLRTDTGIKEMQDFAKSFNKISEEIDLGRDNIEQQEKAFEMKNNVLQIAAHELKTPIGSIKTLLSIAIEQFGMGKTEEGLSMMGQCFHDTDSLSRHINYILNLSALENGSLTKKEAWVSVRNMFNEIDMTFKIACEKKENVSWSCNTPDSVDKRILCDQDLVSVVISNAVDNAVKYTDSGYVNVVYEVAEDMLRVVVKDTGIGLSEDEIETLRTRPKQLASDISRKRDGWGIGFATMQKFARFMGGEIYVESKKGFGTEITITIPTKSVGITEANSNKDPLKKLKRQLLQKNNNMESTVVTNREGSYKLLMIDNDDRHISQMSDLFSPQMLQRDDIAVSFCTNPCEAVNLIESMRFDMIIVDYHMPEMNGLDLLRFIAENETMCSESKKVMLTADTNIPRAEREKIESLSDVIMSKGITVDQARSLFNDIEIVSAI